MKKIVRFRKAQRQISDTEGVVTSKSPLRVRMKDGIPIPIQYIGQHVDLDDLVAGNKVLMERHGRAWVLAMKVREL